MSEATKSLLTLLALIFTSGALTFFVLLAAAKYFFWNEND